MTATEFQHAVLERDDRCPCGKPATVAHHLVSAGIGKKLHDLRCGLGLCEWDHRDLHTRGFETWASKFANADDLIARREIARMAKWE